MYGEFAEAKKWKIRYPEKSQIGLVFLTIDGSIKIKHRIILTADFKFFNMVME